MRVAYGFQPDIEKYLYTDDSNAESKYRHGQDRTLQLVSYLKSKADADTLATRMLFLTKDLLTIARFDMSIAEANKYIGDVFRLTLTRSPFATAGGQSKWPYEIIKKTVSAFPAVVSLEGRDMAQFALNIGYWMADTAPAWGAATQEEREVSGFWSDASGYIDSPDEASLNKSLWW